MGNGTIGGYYGYQNCQQSWSKKVAMNTEVGGNTCPILTFSGFAESPDPSASFVYGWRDNRPMGLHPEKY